ncbi:putative endonuclease [Microbacterium halimionae]|uniref:UPF0102 protein FHX48_000974 n=1 Tax=Microbacterium halimionae TaxID=1526413 RepID=A0A7W3JN31_9MICO|nr:YraN family protein [Microbacterium halimionae]MBA8815901.1 putative endonuclease [Microbacterium halimionae]NII96104.1 putative endonuclease [Microbacterium halimionae]
MAEKDDLGRAGEDCAAEYLERKGYKVLARNWRGERGEIDLVVARGQSLVFVEVKTRRTELFGHPLEAIGILKLRRIWRLAWQWCAAHPAEAKGRSVRVDAVGITGVDNLSAKIEHLEDLR